MTCSSLVRPYLGAAVLGLIWVLGGVFCNSQSGGSGGSSGSNQVTGNDNESDNSHDNGANDNGTTGGGNGEVVTLATSEVNAQAMRDADEEAERLIAEGMSVADVLEAMVEVLEADENVAGAGVDTDGEPLLWVDFINGESQIVQIIDDSTDAAEGSVTDLVDPEVDTDGLQASRSAVEIRTVQTDLPVLHQFADASESAYHLTGNNQALLANTLAELHDDWDFSDSTDVVEFMLEPRGYVVDRGPLTVGLFESVPDVPGQPHKVSITDFSVILLETHNTLRKPEYPAELIQLPAGLGIPNTGTCGGPNSLMVMLTSSVADEAATLARTADIVCGRLTLWKFVRVNDGRVVRKWYQFGVTPNFIREHNEDKFPDNTLFVLNGCRGYWPYPESPWEEVLMDKSDQGAVFMGWTAKVRYPEAARAIMYLFQFLTAADEQIEVNDVRVIRAAVPPRGGLRTPLFSGAYYDLAQKGLNVYPTTGAVLQWTSRTLGYTDMILMPQPLTWERRNEQNPTISMFAGADAMVAIGGTALSLTPISVYNGFYSLPAQPIVFGDFTVVEDNRLSIPRVVHRWRPQIKVESFGDSGPHISATLTLHARSTLDTYSFRASAWDPAPPATFDTVWDSEACSIGWLVSGQHTDDCTTTVYSGGGLETFDPSEHNNGFLRAVADGAGVHVELDVTAPITYTATTTDTCENTMSSSEVTETINVWKYDVGFSSDWTIGAASYTIGTDEGRRISWNAVPAEPPFDPEAEPR